MIANFRKLALQVFQQPPTGNSYQFCDKLCGSTAGLRSYVRVHNNNDNGKKQLIHLSLMQ